MFHAFSQSDLGEQLAAPRPGLGGGHAGDPRREADVLDRGEFRQQMIRLENETDAVVAEFGQFAFGKPGKILPGEMNFARVRRIQTAHQMEQGAFARAGRAAQREEFAARHVEVHPAQHFECAFAHGVSLGEGAGGKKRVAHGKPPFPK